MSEIDLFATPASPTLHTGPVLGFLQNTWVNDVPRCQKILDECGSQSERRYMTTAWLFMGCLTGRRLEAVFGADVVREIVWDNASPKLAGMSSGRFPPDSEHIRSVLDEIRPGIVLAFGRVAQKGILSLWGGPVVCGPHPTARGAETLPAMRDMARQLRALQTVPESRTT